MPPFEQHIRRSTEQMLARQFVTERASLPRRDSVASSSVSLTASAIPTNVVPSTTTLSAESSSSNSGTPGVTLPPHGVAAVIGITVMLSIFVLSFAGWRLWVFRRSMGVAQAASSASNTSLGLFDPVHDNNMKRTLSLGEGSIIAIPPTVGKKVTLTRERTAAEIKVNLAYQPKVIYTASDEKKSTFTGAPPSIKVTPPLGLQISPPPVYVAVPLPALSPRTAASKGPGHSMTSQTSKLPRLVRVDSTFTPSLHDELSIHEGEKLQLLEEYEDEWCLVQRVGPSAAEKGVVPRFCVVEC